MKSLDWVGLGGLCFGRLSVVVLALSGVLLASSAEAARLTNKDSRSYAISIKEQAGSSSKELGANETIEKFCELGCTIVIDGVTDGAYHLPEGTEIVTIESGVLFYDGAIESPQAKEP